MTRGIQIIALIALLLVSSTMHVFAQCRPTPPPVRDLALERYYDDEVGSVVDTDKLQDQRERTAPLRAFVKAIAQYSDRANGVPERPEAARCGLGELADWAAADAYLGKIDGKQSHAQRRWDLAGLSLAYLKIRRFASPEQREAIDPWLRRVADAARKDFDDPGVKRNNHWYWLGLGLAAVGLATQSEPHWSAARDIMLDAARDIAADGTLALELARGQRAVHYHAFASMALVPLAELGFAKGEDWYQLNDGALHRLVATTANGVQQPAVFDAMANTPQERPVKSGGGWLALYQARFPGRLTDAPQQNPGDRRIGGRADVLIRVLTNWASPTPP